MNTQTQISRIQLILGHPSMKTCLDCGFVYLPMNAITNHLCPKCQAEEIEEVKAGILTIQVEEVSTENDDLMLFDKPFKDKEERSQKAKIGAKKAQLSKKLSKK